jgi:hypothetical protein
MWRRTFYLLLAALLVTALGLLEVVAERGGPASVGAP